VAPIRTDPTSGRAIVSAFHPTFSCFFFLCVLFLPFSLA
jgi:hypothetical protein